MKYASEYNKRMRRYQVQERGRLLGEVYLLPENAKREERPPRRVKRKGSDGRS